MAEQNLNGNKPGWERETLEKLAFAALTEQKTARRWNLIFKFAMLAYLILLLGVAVYPKLNKNFVSSDGQHTAVINVVGMIAEGKDSNASDLIESLRNAAKDKNTKGIILHANSPGGSPVQSAYVYDEIRALKKQHPNLPIYTVVSDICASGCYYIAAASDKNLCQPSQYHRLYRRINGRLRLYQRYAKARHRTPFVNRWQP
ncbi:S49 family peptidase [Methylocucumis oryzae]|uniref:S49 family peptidase n=1 Tax=Methylocucumis oryzae TaxID=1632867 RepID=UPI000AF8C4C1